MYDAENQPEAEEERRPGETPFAIFLILLSLTLLWKAYGISEFESLSSPGAIPMAVTFLMAVTAAIILMQTLKLKLNPKEVFLTDIFPMRVLVMSGFIVGFALILQPLGFIPSAMLFLTLSIKFLFRRNILKSALLALLCLTIIYVVFRLVFSVLMPEGIVPEREIIAWVENLFATGVVK